MQIQKTQPTNHISFMKRNLDAILVLYEKSNQGKTSTLRELIKSLAGSLPNDKGDLRAIILDYYAKHQRLKVNVFVATCGDSQEVIEDNIHFFRGKMPDNTLPVFLFKNGTWTLVNDPKLIEGIEANICVSACRTDGNVVDAMQYFMHTNLSYIFMNMWIRLNQLKKKLGINPKAPQWGKVATLLKYIVDNFIAKRYISI